MQENEKMNFEQHEFSAKEEGLEKLKEAVRLRNQMGGALYWNILNDDCLRMADKLLGMGVSRETLAGMLNG